MIVNVPGMAGGERRRWIRFSLPFAEGCLREHRGLSLVGPSGKTVYLQTRPLASWRDGSARWVDCEAVVPEGGTHTVRMGEAGAEPADPACCTEKSGECALGNGRVEIVLSAAGDGPVACLRQEGRIVSPENGFFRCGLTDISGRIYTAANDCERTVRRLSRGPVSSGAEVSGKLAAEDGTVGMSYRLRARVYAGFPVVHMMLWLIHDVPGQPMLEVKDLSFSTAWSIPPEPPRHLHQFRHSLLSVPRDVVTAQPVELRGAGIEDAQIRVRNPECLEDATEYPFYMGLPVNEAPPYAGLSLSRGWVACLVEDFIEKCPKGLRVDGNRITVSVCPDWAEPCAWRQGRSRAMEWRLVFGDEGAPTFSGTQRLAAATGQAAPATVAPERYAESGEFHADSMLRKNREGVRRLDGHLSRLMDLETPIGMWDLGDTREPGYSRTYAAIGRLTSRDPSIPARFRAGGRSVIDWSHPNQYEPVWSNNEYDVIICMAREYMRGGDGALPWQHLKWFARHAVEVDFVHYSDHPQLHHGSPAHSASHDQASSYPSHLWSEGLLAYYCLSGDDDVLDTAVKTGEYIIRYFRDPATRRKVWKFSRELGWALLHVATLADLTGEARFRELSVELADFFVEKELTPEVLQAMVQTSFAYASLVLGVEAVTRFDNRAAYRDWIVRVADGAKKEIDGGHHGRGISMMNLNYLVPAYEISGDIAYLETGRKILEVYLDSASWYEPPNSTKRSAMIFRGLSRFVHHAHNNGLLDAFEYRYAT